MKNQLDKNGNRHGWWEDYYSNGSLLYRRLYKHGKFHVLFEWYYPIYNSSLSGRLGCKGAYKRNNRVGLWHDPSR